MIGERCKDLEVHHEAPNLIPLVRVLLFLAPAQIIQALGLRSAVATGKVEL